MDTVDRSQRQTQTQKHNKKFLNLLSVRSIYVTCDKEALKQQIPQLVDQCGEQGTTLLHNLGISIHAYMVAAHDSKVKK